MSRQTDTAQGRPCKGWEMQNFAVGRRREGLVIQESALHHSSQKVFVCVCLRVCCLVSCVHVCVHAGVHLRDNIGVVQAHGIMVQLPPGNTFDGNYQTAVHQRHAQHVSRRDCPPSA